VKLEDIFKFEFDFQPLHAAKSTDTKFVTAKFSNPAFGTDHPVVTVLGGCFFEAGRGF
jgi:hypothetical protein